MKTERWSGLLAGPLALLLVGGASSAVLGQMVTASLTGTVTDATGASLKDAAVTAVNLKTGVEYPARSNEAGVYTVTGLPIGSYVVRAEAGGFKRVTTNPITLEVGQTARVNLKLEVGGVSETVEVAGVNPILQTENAVVGEVVTGSTMVALPLNGRNFAQLPLLAPGAQHHAPDTFTQVKTAAGNQGGRPYVNGQREQGNNFMLDGIDMNEAIDNRIAYYPSPDAIAEMKIETNNYSAEFGNVAGAVVNVVTKSGTNEFHGNAFEFLRDEAFDANAWANNRDGVEKSPFRQHIFGGTLGGPLVKNKLFFFANYQGTRVDRPGGETATAVAPAAWRNGDFSSLLASGVVIRDPATRAPFPNNQVPASRFSPAARALLGDPSRYPLPTGPGLTGNFVGTQVSRTRNHQGDLKIDANLSPNDNLFLRVSAGEYNNEVSQTPFPLIFGGGFFSTTQSASLNWTRVIGATTVNELRVGFSRVTIDDGTPTDWGGVGNYNQTLGIAGGQALPGLSAINWDSAGIANIGSNAIADSLDNKTLQVSEKLQFSRGRHLLSAGFQALHYRMGRHYPGNNGVLGFFTFSGQFTGHAFADFLLDQVQQKGIGGASPWEQRQNRIGIFFQDDFKAGSKLTLNLGLRWEYASPLVEKDDKQLNYDLKTGRALFANRDGNSRALYDAYYGGFGPRVGFAWSLNDRTVVRGAYGIVQYQEGTGANNRLPQNPPFAQEVQRAYTTTAGSILTGFGDAASAAPGLGVGQLRAFQPDLRPQFTQQWNVFAERKLTDTTSLAVGYVGNRSTHLASFRDINQALPGTGDPSTWPDANSRRPLARLLPNATGIRFTGSDARANYHGLQASLRRRRAKGLEFLASYTLSKALTDNQGFYGPGWGGYNATHSNTGFGDGNQDARNPQADYGPMWFSSKHTASLSGHYELPIGKDRKLGSQWSGAKQALLGGWNLGAILSVRSGLPITVTNGWTSRSLQPNGFTYERPDRIGSGTVSNASWDRWIDIAAFRDAELGTFGDSGVGILRGPGFYNLDMSVDKNFDLGGTRYFALRVEAFNVLNHPNKGLPVRDFSNKAQFGKILGTANAARSLELAIKLYF
jgi:outer membrane receptor protein involved in Fe transport